MIAIKRIYEPASERDGLRVLVDRVWPRGISRFDAKLDLWDKDVAPSTELRKWFGHRPERWKEFQKRYRAELKACPALDALRDLARRKRVTLLYAARDAEHNHALVLRSVLSHLPRKKAKQAGRRAAASEGQEVSSQVCYAKDADPAYMGFLPPEELGAFLNEMLEAERAGARVTLKSTQQAKDKAVRALMQSVHRDEARWCALLLRSLKDLGIKPSAKTGAFYGKAMAIPDLRERLAFLNRGQGWVVRKLKDVLPKIRDDNLHRNLSDMLRSHEDNIDLVDASLAGK